MKDSMLCAIGYKQMGVVLAYQGDTPKPSTDSRTYPAYPDCRIGFELNEYSLHLNDHFKEAELPKEPGIYVWEGNVIATGYSDGEGGEDCDVDWVGSFRPAEWRDFLWFKVMAPSITAKDI